MIALLAGPPFNKSLEEIGWLTRRQIQTLFLRHRDYKGLLDLEAVMAERRAQEPQEVPDDPREGHRLIRRLQGWPEYRIEAEWRKMEAEQRGERPA